ncbi:BON domain-containing protein [Dongia rigui]|uniref:BON domain-containing protein n=1 Tax=Dongia rigui TaxID=940149 RepID=A0ABU5DYW0_9PROT|nr:BON domain-containing protein [Dongia rigui]MDY0871833.1 BON domain-containing protein [Dongia rigui]
MPLRPLRLVAGGVAGLFLAALLPACSPVGTAVGVAATTINLATQERGLVTGVDDNLTWVTINERLLRHDQYLFQKVSLQVHEGRVLLTGFVQKPEDKQLATELAWQPSGVREVRNEIKIGRSLDLGDYSEDAWLIQRLRLKLMADRQVRANNFSIDCIRSTVYLTGIAQNDVERQRVIDHARDIAYVRQVVSYVRLVSDPLPPVPATKPYPNPPPGPAKKKAVEQPVVAATVDRLPSSPAASAPGQPAPAQPALVEKTASAEVPLLPRSTQPATSQSVPVTLP